jgi:hypothetical protein
MSLLTKASLVMTPNAIKSNKVYSIIPSNGNGDLTFTRDTSATQINSLGNVENVLTTIPRLNYDTVGGCPSLLLEPQRMNLLSYSDDFSFASWIKKGLTTISINSTISPDGTINADTLNNASGSLVWDSGNTLQRDILISALTTYTFSVYVKSLGSTTFSIGLRNQSTGAIVSANIVPNSQWQRISVTQTTTVNTSIGFLFGNTNGNVAIWGAQLEQGAYPTSYIPTTTTALTRNADVSSKSGISDLIGQTEGVMFIESAALFNDLTSRRISISDGSNSNRLLLFYNSSSNLITVASVSANMVVVSGINFSIDTTQFAKIAVRYSNTLGYSLWVNGVNRGTSAVTTLPIGMSRFGFDAGIGLEIFYAKVKQVQLYKTYLTDTEMTQLTTL